MVNIIDIHAARYGSWLRQVMIWSYANSSQHDNQFTWSQRLHTEK